MLLVSTFVLVLAAADVALLDDGVTEKKTITNRQTYSPMQCSSSSGAFSYDLKASNGPSHWSNLAECCGGNMQSPINILTSSARCGRLFRFYHSRFPMGQLQGEVSNSGHAAKLKFTSTPKVTMRSVPHRGLSKYVLSELHIHAGNDPGTGSEHRIDGRGYDGELHIIHYKEEYGSVAAALTKPDGLAVIGVFLQQSGVSTNRELNRLISQISSLGSTIGQKIDASLNPRKLVPRDGDFYTYQGSLTTPPCSESVRWIVMKTPIQTTAANLNVLKMLPTDEGAPVSEHTNVRPYFTQGSRKLETNFRC